MRTKLFVIIALLIAMPLTITAEVIYVGYDVATLEEAIATAEEGDTIVVSSDMYYDALPLVGGDFELVVDDIEPPDAPHDSMTYGPKNHIPATPVE